MKKISIIIPVYNAEKYLEECLDSVLNQSYKNLEIIIVDDGSNDNSKAICDKFAIDDCRIKLLFQENSGVASARNLGLTHVTGDYITFIDADDYVHKDYISFMKDLSDNQDSDIVQVHYVRSSSFDKGNFGLPKEDFISCNGKSLHFAVCGGGSTNLRSMLWCKLFKAEVFEGVSFPVGLIHEDEAVMHMLFDNANKFISNQTVLYYYRTTEDSIMNKKVSAKNLDVIAVLNSRKNFYKGKGFTNFYYLSLQRASVAIVELYRRFESSNALTKEISDTLYSEYEKNFNELKTSPFLDEKTLEIHKIWLGNLAQEKVYSIWSYISKIDESLRF